MHGPSWRRPAIYPARVAVGVWLLVAAAACVGAGDDAEFVPIFNGRDLEGWDGAPGYWFVENGLLTGRTTADRPLKRHSYLIWRGGPLDDFELRLAFRLRSGNSGVQYRGRDLGDHDVAGYQCNIQTAKPGATAVLEEMKNGRGGRLAEVGKRVEIAPHGERVVTGQTGDSLQIESTLDRRGWNQLTIIARGDRLIHKLNGRVAIDVTDRQEGKAARSGILALQLHSGKPMTVEFKDIRLARRP
jgi:hypothetical protein